MTSQVVQGTWLKKGSYGRFRGQCVKQEIENISWGVGKIGISGGGYSLWAIFGKSRGEEGSYEKSLPWVGYGYFLEPHIVA